MNTLRFAFRQLFKNPGFTTVAVLTLALGIGANTATFSIINGVLLRPLPYPHPDRLVTLWERNPRRGVEQEKVSGPTYLDWRQQNTVFSDLAVMPGWAGSEEFNLVLPNATTKVQASYASASLFTTLGTRPMLGRTLLPEEDQREGNRAAVLSHQLWMRLFGGDLNIIGRPLTLDTYGRRDYTIVGVMPPGFGLPSRCELWLPLGWMGVTLDERRSAHWHNVIARLKPGATPAQARAELNAIQTRLNQAYPGMDIGPEVAVVPLVEQGLGRSLRLALLVLWGVVAGVLLIACANLAHLLLARAESRRKEIAVRIALGAHRWRVMWQLLMESLVLALLGGAAGVFLGWQGLHLFLAASPPNIPRLDNVTLDGTALAFTLGISLVTGLLFGLAPAWQGSHADLSDALKEGSRGASSSASATRTRNVLVIAEVGLSLVLLVGAGLMLQSFARMLRAERGFEPTQLLTAELDFSVSGFTTWIRPDATRPQVALLQLMERLRALPGVQAVGAGSCLLRRENQPPNVAFSIFGRPPWQPEEQPKANFTGVSPGWIGALGVRLHRGRDFTEADTLQAPGVVVVNETLARRYFPNEDPVGRYLKMGADQPPLDSTNRWGTPIWCQIVGVISDVGSLHPQPQSVPEIYSPYWQWPMQNPTLLIRGSGDPVDLAAAVRRETKALIPSLPPPRIHTMTELLNETVAQPRLETGLLGLFGTVALLLTMVGIYGVVALSVSQRTRELGIRIALGAQKSNVLALVLRQGMRLVLLGVGWGLVAALALTRILRSLLYGVTPTDPWTMAAAAALLATVALLACWLPARRAARVDPMVALRAE